MKWRLEILRKMAQAAPGTTAAPGAAPTAPNAATTPKAATRVDIRTVPKFNPNLFAAKPAMIGDLNNIINKINGYMSSLSSGAITFATVYTSPSASGAKFSDSTQHLLTISKWLYNAITMQAQPYSMAGLAKLATDFIKTVNSYPFSDAGAANIKSDLTTLGTIMSSKIVAH